MNSQARRTAELLKYSRAKRGKIIDRLAVLLRLCRPDDFDRILTIAEGRNLKITAEEVRRRAAEQAQVIANRIVQKGLRG